MSLAYLNQFSIENVSSNFKGLQLITLITGLIFNFLFVIFLDKKRVHIFLLGFFQSAIRSQLLMNPVDSESKQRDGTKKGGINSSVKKDKRVDPILHGGDAEDIVIGSLRLMSNPEEARFDVESHEIFSLFEEKDPSPDEVKDAFDVFDCNGDGFIDPKDLQKVLCSLGLDKGLGMDSFKRMIDVFDDNGDGRLDFGEFVRFLEFSL
ncbi:putative calcium-binding protein CML46 [Primulina tabacum]|uniref:putative calcium-binding protein CML46 n=1 Tax=Primulina tabacum TaxID=48773 RepID=UPI003F5A3E6F